MAVLLCQHPTMLVPLTRRGSSGAGGRAWHTGKGKARRALDGESQTRSVLAQISNHSSIPGQAQQSCKPGCGDTTGTDRPYQNALPRLQAPEGTLCVDLVGEFPFHEDVLAAPLQHRYANRAAADIHRHLETERERK